MTVVRFPHRPRDCTPAGVGGLGRAADDLSCAAAQLHAMVDGLEACSVRLDRVRATLGVRGAHFQRIAALAGEVEAAILAGAQLDGLQARLRALASDAPS